MARYLRPVASLILMSLLFSIPVSTMASAGSLPTPETHDLWPDNTVILSNARDARFSRDFSVLLKHLRLPWVVLNGPDLSDDLHDKHLVLVGHPEARHTGDLMRAILTADEIATLASATDHVILEKPSPWHADRTVVVCSGADLIQTRNAAEEAVRAIVEAAPPASDWLRTTYETEVDANLRDALASALHTWDDAELSVDELTMDVEARAARRISADQAAADVERLFYLLSHGYAGYGTHNRQGQFAQAKADILQELSTKRAWTSGALSALLHEHLGFITDCHLTIGDHKYGRSRRLLVRYQARAAAGGRRLHLRGSRRCLHRRLDRRRPSQRVPAPSLNAEGAPIYRLGSALVRQAAPPGSGRGG